MQRTLRITLTKKIAKKMLEFLPPDQMTVDANGGIIGVSRQDCVPIFFMVRSERGQLTARQVQASDEYRSIGLVVTVRTAKNAEMFCAKYGYLTAQAEKAA